MAKSVYIGIDDVARKVKKLYIGVDGVARQVKKGYIGVNGIARLFYQSGLPLSSLPHGALVRINENSSPVPFYLAKHDYESNLNGIGRTLLVRKEAHSNQVWNESNVNSYADSTLDTWLNGTYKTLLDSKLQEAIATTKFPYTPGNGNNTLSSLSRSVFILSAYELGKANTGSGQQYCNNEGSTLPIADSIRVARYNGNAVYQWTRTPAVNSKSSVQSIRDDDFFTSYSPSYSRYVLPCFTLPSTMLVSSEPNADGSYTLLV